MIAEWNVRFERYFGVIKHVSAFGFDAATGVWVVVDPHRAWTEVLTLPPNTFDLWVSVAAEDSDIYRIAARRETGLLFPGLWCVGAVKRLVGLKSGALSPAGLRRDLLRAGARKVFSRESQNAAADA